MNRKLEPGGIGRWILAGNFDGNVVHERVERRSKLVKELAELECQRVAWEIDWFNLNCAFPVFTDNDACVVGLVINRIRFDHAGITQLDFFPAGQELIPDSPKLFLMHPGSL
ncbi:MAG: hypothetical protein ACPHCI_08805 [Solirubrobacterales bacterium]